MRAIWRRFDRLFDDARKDMERQNRAFDTCWREVSVLIDSLGDTLRSDAGNEITDDDLLDNDDSNTYWEDAI